MNGRAFLRTFLFVFAIVGVAGFVIFLGAQCYGEHRDLGLSRLAALTACG